MLPEHVVTFLQLQRKLYCSKQITTCLSQVKLRDTRVSSVLGRSLLSCIHVEACATQAHPRSGLLQECPKCLHSDQYARNQLRIQMFSRVWCSSGMMIMARSQRCSTSNMYIDTQACQRLAVCICSCVSNPPRNLHLLSWRTYRVQQTTNAVYTFLSKEHQTSTKSLLKLY